MISRTPPLLAGEPQHPERSTRNTAAKTPVEMTGKAQAPSHAHARRESILHDTQEDTMHTTATAAPTPRTGLVINRNFGWLVGGQAISNLGDFVYSTTLFIWVFTLTHSAAAVSGVLAAQYVPVFLLGPLAGVLVDRWNRRQTMLVSDLIRAGAATFPLLAPASLRLQAIYASVLVISAVGRFFMPAEAGLLQAIVADHEQVRAASIKQAIFALAIIGGPALASPLYFAVGPALAVLLNALSYLVSAVCLALIRAPRAALHPHAVQQHERAKSETTDRGLGGMARSLLRELAAGVRFVAMTRTVLMVTVMALIAMLGAGALNALNIVFASTNLHMATAFYGVLTAVGGVGGFLGIILAGTLAKWIAPRHILSGSALLIGTGFAIYSFQSWYVAGIIICFLMSIPQGGIPVAFGPLLLNATPRGLMGRVQAVVDTSMSGVSLLSVALAGYLGQVLPIGVILAGCGLLIALAGLFGWFAIQEPLPAQAQPGVRPHFA